VTKLACLCKYCGKEWDESPVLYSPDTTRCSVCGSSGAYYIRIRKKTAKKVDYYAPGDGAHAQEAPKYAEIAEWFED
jgi:hypothetical protein